MANITLKDLLVSFLKGEEIYCPQIEASILQANPFQISDDKIFYFDSCNLQELTESALQNTKKKQKLILKNWNFVFRRVPGTHDYYFDINCKEWELAEDDSIPEENLK